MCRPPDIGIKEAIASDLDAKSNVKERARGLAAVICFVSMFSIASSIPYITTKRQSLACETLCIGSITSLRSSLSLFGAPATGRLSDRIGRRAALLAGAGATLASALLTAFAGSKRGLWLAVIPSALLSHQFDILKSVLADVYAETDAATLAGAQGTLGVAAGIGFVGSMFGAFLTSGLRLGIAAILSFLLSCALIMTLPISTKKSNDETIEKKKVSLLTFGRDVVSLPCARSRCGFLLLFIRGGAALAFHVFNTIWQPSLVRRFPNWGTVETSRFMTYVGILYAVSQGLVAQRVLRFAAASKILTTPRLLVLCCLTLSTGRIVAISTTSVKVIYACYALMIIALGTFNSAITSAVSRVAPFSERGGFFGLLSAVESVCGIFGPVLSGFLATISNELSVCFLVLTLYAAVAFLSAIFWQSLPSSAFAKASSKASSSPGDTEKSKST